MMDINTIVRETLEAVKQDYVTTFPEGTQKLSDPFALTKILEPGLVRSATIFLQKCVEVLNCEIKVKTDDVFFKWVESTLNVAIKTAEDGKPGSYSGAFIETDDFAAAALFGVSSPRLRGGSELLYVYPFNYFQTVCLIRYLQLRLAERRQTNDVPGSQAVVDTAPPPKKYVVSDSLKEVVHKALTELNFIDTDGEYSGGHIGAKALFVALIRRKFFKGKKPNNSANILVKLFKSEYGFDITAKTFYNGASEAKRIGENVKPLKKLISRYLGLRCLKSDN